jgi:hypothetical protein
MVTTQRGLVREFAKTIKPGELVLRNTVIEWVKSRFHGEGKKIGQSVDGMTVNHKYRVGRKFGENDLVDIYFRIGKGKNAQLRLYAQGDSPFYPAGRR